MARVVGCRARMWRDSAFDYISGDRYMRYSRPLSTDPSLGSEVFGRYGYLLSDFVQAIWRSELHPSDNAGCPNIDEANDFSSRDFELRRRTTPVCFSKGCDGIR